LIFSSKENLFLPLLTAKDMLTTNSLPHPLMVTIVFSNKCWGSDVSYESRGAGVRVLQIGSVNELKDLADV